MKLSHLALAALCLFCVATLSDSRSTRETDHHPQPQAREHLAGTAAAARQALDDVREVTASYRDAARPDAMPAQAGVTLAPRLAQAVFVMVLCAVAVQYVNDVAENLIDVPGGGKP